MRELLRRGSKSQQLIEDSSRYLDTEQVLGWLFGGQRLDQDQGFRDIANFVAGSPVRHALIGGIQNPVSAGRIVKLGSEGQGRVKHNSCVASCPELDEDLADERGFVIAGVAHEQDMLALFVLGNPNPENLGPEASEVLPET